MQITLNNDHLRAAIECANIRMYTSNQNGWNNASTYKRTILKRLEEEVTGACGEIAVALALRTFWTSSCNTFHTVPDVGADIEVRATTLDNGSLIVRDNDPDDRWYILVTGTPPLMTIRGRIKGIDAKRPEWIRDPHNQRKAFFVPQSHLRPLPTADI